MTIVSGSYRVTKTSVVEEQNAYGWFNIASRGGDLVVDAHGDVIHVDDLQNAAHEFVREARVSGVDHNGEEPDGQLIASIVFTDDVIEAISTDPATGELNAELHDVMKRHIPRGWFGGFHIPGVDAWQAMKEGKASFSIKGWAEEVEDI